jgi:hypothetical protein
MIVAFDTFTDVIFGYVVSFGAIAVVAWRIIHRGRVLSRQVPDEDKSWL